VLALTSIGTLFAFVLVCAGVIVLQKSKVRPESKFRVPHVSGKYIIPLMLIIAIALILKYDPEHFKNCFTRAGFPMGIFWLIAIIIAVLTFVKDFSLIPVLGFTSCFYLMAQESHTNWERFLVWLVIGLCIYFTYGYKNSRLNKETNAAGISRNQ
jgi:APA family basic amino acid/polyamine antiporter